MFGKNKPKGDEVRAFKIFTDQAVDILDARFHNNKLSIEKTDEEYKIPDMCSFFLWKESKFPMRTNFYKCYLVVNGIPIAIDYKHFLNKKEGLNKKDIIYNPEEIKAFTASKVFTDFMNFKAGIKAWLVIVCIAGGALFGFAISMILRAMGYL